MAGMFRLYSQFGLVMAPDRYFWGSGSLPKNYVQSLELDVIADLCTAQAGGGTDHSRWRAGCPISRAASSTPKIKFVTLSLYSKTSQELRMLSRSLSDCKSLLLNVRIQISQFVSNCIN